MQSVSLHSSAGGADKLYNVFLLPKDDGYIVNYQNGRRGGTLTNGTKTATPVPLDKAQAIFEQIAVTADLTSSSSRKTRKSHSTLILTKYEGLFFGYPEYCVELGSRTVRFYCGTAAADS
jgi:hypothetical protein